MEITLKHETILKHYLLQYNISENHILFVICCIVKLLGHKGIIKNTHMVHCRLSNIPCLPHSYLFILSDALMLLGNALMLW